MLLHLLTTAIGRFCCKSPFALVIKISFGCTRDFRVKMWGTSSPDDKLTDDLRNAIEGTRISGRRWSFLTAEKLAPGDLGLLQQYQHFWDIALCDGMSVVGGRRHKRHQGHKARDGSRWIMPGRDGSSRVISTVARHHGAGRAPFSERPSQGSSRVVSNHFEPLHRPAARRLPA